MIRLTLTDEQARLVSLACEFYARIRLGQFKEILWCNYIIQAMHDDNYFERRDLAENLLYQARDKIYPDLHGPGHSYGMGKFEDADKAFDVHQVIRFALGDPRPPFSNYDIPKCEVVKE